MKTILIVIGIVLILIAIGFWAKSDSTENINSGYLDRMTGALNDARDLNQKSYTLDMSNQNLTSLPTELFEDKGSIRVFDVSANALTGALPAEIHKLSSLEKLDASGNRLTGIPAEIGQLSNIQEIDFSGNRIDTYPNEIANISDTLKVLNLTGNTFSQTKISELRALLPSTQILF